MGLQEFVKKLRAKTEEDDGCLVVLKEALGGEFYGDYFYCWEYSVEAVVMIIDDVHILAYRNFVPLWRYTDILDCLAENWRDLYPTQEFFLIAYDDFSVDELEDIRDYIYTVDPKFRELVAVELTSEGF